MSRDFFKAIETLKSSHSLPLTDVINHIPFNEKGLVPVITQDKQSQQVLMLAWMNREALKITLNTGHMTYWSRSRQSLWSKGETSGHTQQLMHMSLDCDGDAILCQVNQNGSACHTGRRSCFYLEIDRNKQEVVVTGESSLP